MNAAGLATDSLLNGVVATLEREGIEKFVASFTELLEGIAEKHERLALAV